MSETSRSSIFRSKVKKEAEKREAEKKKVAVQVDNSKKASQRTERE